MAKRPTLKLVKGLAQTVEEWIQLHREKSRRKVALDKIEKEMKKLEPPIKEALKKAPDRESEFGPHVLQLTKDSIRRTFEEERAIAELGSETTASFFSEKVVEGYIRIK